MRPSCEGYGSLTRSASDGSVPLAAPARAAVKLSTSSACRARPEGEVSLARPSTSGGQERRTDQHHDETRLVLDHLGHGRKQLLDELARLGEPLGEERVRVDLDQLAVRIPVRGGESGQRQLACTVNCSKRPREARRTGSRGGWRASAPVRGRATSCPSLAGHAAGRLCSPRSRGARRGGGGGG